MAKTITLHDDIYRKLASYGNRDESYNTIVLRLLENLEDKEAKKDMENRTTEFEPENINEGKTKYPVLYELEDGTEVRYKIKQGDYEGEKRVGTVENSRIVYNESKWSPTGFAREADKDIRGSDARSSEAYRGPTEVEFQDEGEKWVPIKAILER
jgi:predicted CopG family antitoxin